MSYRFLNSDDDLEWLKDVHIPNPKEPIRSFVIYGNDDSPEKIECYPSKEPLHTDVPVVYTPTYDEDGNTTFVPN